MAVCLITAVIAANISACNFQGTKENGAGEGGATTFDPLNNEKAEQGMTELFSSLMSLKLPQGLEVQSKETSTSKLVFADSNKKVRLEIQHDPEQMVSDSQIDMGRLKLKAILEQDNLGVTLEWLKDETQLVHGKCIAINEVIIPSKKGNDTYHFKAWAELDGALLEIDFTAPANMKDEWQNAVHGMIESIQM
ncbi:hypothetical protein RE628_22785 [Paenibacillus sp. D2_2]|uniref:hypothetical protein n=1 Tax=Paenibacillus sp. D2_2 TaxID=3073092 RepID=UPI00281570FF|nr:hypothetical protein [Paenibacillus sp. D2_2]WMT40104.1 hypothetical protein RE628_22785 [Paenibacillus sp. D2_2]